MHAYNELKSINIRKMLQSKAFQIKIEGIKFLATNKVNEIN